MNSNSKSKVLVSLLATLAAGVATATQPTDVVATDYAGNTAMGGYALYDLSAPDSPLSIDNTAAGGYALVSNTTGSYNSGFGYQVLNENTSGVGNTAMGYWALISNKVGSDNSAFGYGAMAYSTGNYNAAFGASALYSKNTGYYNTAMGYRALYSNLSGASNTAIGQGSLETNSSGEFNTSVGTESMAGNQIGVQNTALGTSALLNNSSGSNNIALGYTAGSSVLLSNNIEISNPGTSSDSGIIRIGAPGAQTAAYIAGVATAKVTGNAVYVTASGQLGTIASSERYKNRITTMGEVTSKLTDLRPVTFHLKNDPNGELQYGLIAEEVVKVIPELVIRDDAGNIQGVRYDELAPMLLNEVQKQQRTITSQELRLATQDAKLEAEDAKLSKLEQTDATLQAALTDLLARDHPLAMR